MFLKYASALAIVSVAVGEASAANYKVTVLQDVGGQGYSYATGINDSRQIVGSSDTAHGADAVLWSSTGTGTVLKDVGGQGSSFAGGINDSGQIVGSSYTAHGADAVGADAVLWSSTETGTVLKDVSGQGSSFAAGINDSGQIVGTSLKRGPGLHLGRGLVVVHRDWHSAPGCRRPGVQPCHRDQRLRPDRRVFSNRGRRRCGLVVVHGRGDKSRRRLGQRLANCASDSDQ